ncbi:MAG: alkaline phosphatase D family protein, partial [Bacteroidia bacterium]
PLSDRVILWTRVTPDSTVTGNISVSYDIALDSGFTQMVYTANTIAKPERDFTVKVDAANLSPNTYYYYRFHALNKTSIIGRTKTLPVGAIDTLRFAVVSCANYAMGYFHAYEEIARRNDVEAVIHLGDYLYEYGDPAFVPDHEHSPAQEILNLMEYRMRHSQYKLDAQLRYAHQQYPFICVWDDHEIANDAWTGGAENHDDASEGLWADRKAAALKAYEEWMPIRLPDLNDSTRIYRTFQYGDLAKFIMLDTRHHGREEQSSFGTTNNDPNRTLLGQDQLAWFEQELDSATTQWKMIGQQVMIAPLRFLGAPLNQDQWDGYPAERQKIYDHILSDSIENVVVLTGDIHSSWANDLPYDSSYDPATGANSVAVEFVATSVSSIGSPINVPLNILQAANDHVKYANLDQRGFVIMDVNTQRTQGEWYHLSSVLQDSFTTDFATGWYVNAGERFLRQANAPSPPSSIVNQPPAPFSTWENAVLSNSPQLSPTLTVLATYPNPFTSNFVVEYHLQRKGKVHFLLTDAQGKEVRKIDSGEKNAGLYVVKVETQDLPQGIYYLTCVVNGERVGKVLLH